MNPFKPNFLTPFEGASTSGSGRGLDAAAVRRERKEAQRLDALRYCDAGRSRGELAERLSRVAGERVSLATLDKWLALESDREMPARLDAAWCAVVGSTALKNVGAGMLGGRYVGPDDIRKIALANADLQAASWRLRLQRLRDSLLLAGVPDPA